MNGPIIIISLTTVSILIKPPWYNWNNVESGVNHHQTNTHFNKYADHRLCKTHNIT
jgi:hypothetical protein